MSLFAGFIDTIAEAGAKAAAKNLAKSWVAAGFIEPAKEAELEAGLVDLAEVVAGMVAKGQAAPSHG